MVEPRPSNTSKKRPARPHGFLKRPNYFWGNFLFVTPPLKGLGVSCGVGLEKGWALHVAGVIQGQRFSRCVISIVAVNGRKYIMFAGRLLRVGVCAFFVGCAEASQVKDPEARESPRLELIDSVLGGMAEQAVSVEELLLFASSMGESRDGAFGCQRTAEKVAQGGTQYTVAVSSSVFGMARELGMQGEAELAVGAYCKDGKSPVLTVIAQNLLDHCFENKALLGNAELVTGCAIRLDEGQQVWRMIATSFNEQTGAWKSSIGDELDVPPEAFPHKALGMFLDSFSQNFYPEPQK